MSCREFSVYTIKWSFASDSCRRVGGGGLVLPVEGSSACLLCVLYIFCRSKVAVGQFITGFPHTLFGSSLFAPIRLRWGLTSRNVRVCFIDAHGRSSQSTVWAHFSH